ncbi:MAG: antitoxin [Acidimicrobiia bacterium]|nr:antitoxin [Acidimicrobiia bacterium]
MRTTIDIPDDIHALARQIAHEQNQSLSRVIADLIRRGLPQRSVAPAVGARGMPQVSVGRVVTAEDVRSLDDEG